MVPETSLISNQLTCLTARENVINTAAMQVSNLTSVAFIGKEDVGSGYGIV
jgi:hypothetical protein